MSSAVDLTGYDVVILDFDGPMCNVFAGYPAATIAQELTQLLVVSGWPAGALPAIDDPHEILRLVHNEMMALTPPIEAALSAAELRAIHSGPETPG